MVKVKSPGRTCIAVLKPVADRIHHMSPETASKERIGFRRLLLSKIAQFPPSLRATMKTSGDAAAKMKIFGESPFVTLVVGFAAADLRARSSLGTGLEAFWRPLCGVGPALKHAFRNI